MHKRYIVFILIEEVFFLAAMAWSFDTHPVGAGNRQLVSMLAIFAVAVAIADAVIYLVNRGGDCSELRFGGKALCLASGMLLTAAVFYVAFGMMHALVGVSITQLGALRLAAMAGLGIGGWGFMGYHLAAPDDGVENDCFGDCDGGREQRERAESADGGLTD